MCREGDMVMSLLFRVFLFVGCWCHPYPLSVCQEWGHGCVIFVPSVPFCWVLVPYLPTECVSGRGHGCVTFVPGVLCITVIVV